MQLLPTYSLDFFEETLWMSYKDYDDIVLDLPTKPAYFGNKFFIDKGWKEVPPHKSSLEFTRVKREEKVQP